jgi:hypothetical protein
MRVSESLFVCSLGCKLRGAHLGRQQQRVFGKDCLDLLLLDIIAVSSGDVESGFAVLKRAGVSAGAWRGRACMCDHACASPSLALPRRTLLPRHSHTVAHDCEHAATGGRMGAPVYAEADKTRLRHTWRAGVRSAAGPQRQERPRQAATLSRAGHPALRTRTSASTLQQGVAWAPSRAMHPPRQCMRTRP